MKALLLGPNGQLGHDVRRASEDAPNAVEPIPLDRAALDVSMPEAVERTLGALEFDVLVNCTGYHKTDDAEDNAALAVAVNAHAVRAMARVCAGKGARLIHVSTDYVFGGGAARAAPLDEDAATAPINVYGASKALGETLALLECEDVVVLRVASLFGVAGSSGKGGNFVETMIRAGREKGALRVVADQTMSPTATADVARVILRILAEGCAPGVYHAVNSGAATWYEFAREIVERAGVAAEVAPCSSADYPARAARPRYSVLDNARISSALGATVPPWQDALERYLRAKGHIR